MGLKESHGNMYDWVTHMHSHLGGECPHKCSYCYVQKNRFGVSPRYKGECRLVEDEFRVKYGKDKTIFIEHMNDMFAKAIPQEWIDKILFHCGDWLGNKYIFQTKNPTRAFNFIEKFPKDFMMGTTIETNRDLKPDISQAPQPVDRAKGIRMFSTGGFKTFITIEPALDFDVLYFIRWIGVINPTFVNIGIDSKNCGLPEPSKEKILDLISGIQKLGIEIRKKVNLKRLGIDMEK